MSSQFPQLIEEVGLPFSSEEALFSQSFNEKGGFEYAIVCLGYQFKTVAEKDYSMQPTCFNKLFVEVWASVIAFVLSPERDSLLTESVSLLR